MRGNIEKWSKAENIVAPENRFQLAEVRFLQICAFVNRAVIDAANFNGQRIGLRRNQQIRAQAAKFARHAVAHFERDGQRRRRHGHSHDQRRRGQNLRRGLRANDWRYDSCEHCLGVNHRVGVGERGKIDDHFSSCHARFHRDRIAAAAIANRRNVNRRAAIVADHVLAFLAVAGAAANLAGIQRRGVIAVRSGGSP